MYIRTKTTPRSKSTSIQVVESFRVNGKSKQRVIRHIGTANTEKKIEELKLIAKAVKIELEHQRLRELSEQKEASLSKKDDLLHKASDETLVDLNALEELGRKVLGIHDVYGHVYELLNFSNPFKYPKRREFSAGILKDIVLARIAQPGSKRSSVNLLQENFDRSINLDHVYQMMDKIDDTFCERIQKNALATTLKLTGEKLRVLFYDATTLYFESFSEDTLKQNGYSKDMKFNQPQVLLTLFVTQQGLPVGYELFPGATFEGHTLIPVLNKLKERYQIDEVVFVADRGMLCEANLKYLEENNFRYIVGARLKSLKKSDMKTVLDWAEDIKKDTNKEDGATYRFETKNGRQVILSYRVSRANKDKADREKAIKKLQAKLNKSKDPKSLISNYGYQKFLKLEGESTISVDQDKLEAAAAWDGITGVYTNKTDLTDNDIWEHYRSLWQIEESFRINKHDLKMRPVFHWKENRVKAHIAICFMAFVCVRYLEYRVAKQYKKLSPEVLRKALLQMQASLIKDNQSGKQFLLPSKINPEAKQIYRILGIKPILSISEIKM